MRRRLRVEGDRTFGSSVGVWAVAPDVDGDEDRLSSRWAKMRAGLTTRLLLATGVLALVVTAAYVALYVALADLSRARAGAIHSVQEVNVASDVRRLLIDMETGQRGFIITGEPSFLEPWEIGRRMLPERVATLRKIVDDPEQAKASRTIGDGLPCLHQGVLGTAGGCSTRGESGERGCRTARRKMGKRHRTSLRLPAGRLCHN